MDKEILDVAYRNPGALEVMIKLVENYPDKLPFILSVLQTKT
jgi:hypothetical protein